MMMFFKQKPFFLFAAFGLMLFYLGLLTACTQHTKIITLSGQTMGTSYTVKYLVPSDTSLPDGAEVQQQLEGVLREVNRQMSTYDPQSDISQFNQQTAASGAREIEADFAQVLNEAMRLNVLTEGALDVTIGPLVNLWGFGPDKSVQQSPTREQLQMTQTQVGLDKLVFRQPENGQKATLAKTTDGVYLDFSAIAKGFGVDKLAQHLDGLGIHDYLVEIGGELRSKGKNAHGQAWRVAIEQPSLIQQQNSHIVISLHNLALATSGDYRNFHSDEHGNRLSHIINPKTQQPISHNLASVSVVADNTMTADGLATGLYVLGEHDALRVAEQHKLAVFFIIKTEKGFEGKMSSEFAKLVGQP